MSETIDNPYAVGSSIWPRIVTERGFTIWQCVIRFGFFGLIASAMGGGILAFLTWFYIVGLWQQLSVPGLLFGAALWLSVHRCIGSVSGFRKLSLIVGSLLSFVIFGIVYDNANPDDWYARQPISWRTLRPVLYAGASGFAVLVVFLRVSVAGASARILFLIWLAGTLVSATGVFVIDEFGWRRREYSIELLIFIASIVTETTMLALIGWQLAAAYGNPASETHGLATDDEQNQ